MNIIIIELYNKVCEMIDEKLRMIDNDLWNIEQDVDRYLRKLELNLAEVSKLAKTKEESGVYARIHERFINQKNGHKQILMAERKKYLEKAKQQLCVLQNKVNTFFSDITKS